MLKRIQKLCLLSFLALSIVFSTNPNAKAQTTEIPADPIGTRCFAGDSLVGIYSIDYAGWTIQYALCQSKDSYLYSFALDAY